MLARSLMVALTHAGHITLPPVRATLTALATLELHKVRGTEAETLVDALIAEQHYLGATCAVDLQLKYLELSRRSVR